MRLSPEEFLDNPERITAALRFGMHTTPPGGFRGRRIMRDMLRRHPWDEKYHAFFETIIVDAGLEAQMDGLCPHLKNPDTKKERREHPADIAGCRLQDKPLWCRARPLDPSLPECLQDEALYFLKTHMNCPGKIEPEKDGLVQQRWLRGSTLAPCEASEAFFQLQRQQEEWLPVMEILTVRLFERMGEDEVKIFRSGLSRDMFRAFPVSVFLGACVEAGRVTKERALEILKVQKRKYGEAMEDFRKKYGKKMLFPERRRDDGDNVGFSRERFLARMRAWSEECGKILSAAKIDFCAVSRHSAR